MRKNQLTRVTKDSVEAASFKYDPAGRRVEKARYYDPGAGRFISEDSIGFAGEANFYAYAGGDPVNRIDPDGHDAIYHPLRRVSGRHRVGIQGTSSRLETLSALHDDGTGPTTTITSFSYGYDDAGNRTSKTTLDYAESYGYDDLYRLTHMTPTGAGANAWVYGYDDVGNRTTYQQGATLVSPVYNARNQLISTTTGGQLLVRGILDEPGYAFVNEQPAQMLEGNVFEATINADPGRLTSRPARPGHAGDALRHGHPRLRAGEPGPRRRRHRGAPAARAAGQGQQGP
jgi:RHS repeat-associated protein